MSFFRNQGTPTKASPLLRVLNILYWILFSISLVIVLVFIIFQIFIRKPDIGSNEIIVNPNVTINVPGSSPQNPQNPSSGNQQPQQPQQLVLHRNEGVYTCLLAGTDDGNGCADTIMLGVFNTVNKTAALISIPRDTLVEVNGKEYKINAMYAAGGIELICDTVSELLAVPVDFYVTVDLQAFSAIIEEIGGVWFTVPQDMVYKDPFQNLDINIKAGYQLLDGKNALDLMRFRSGYSNQDLGRVQTQRNFLVAMVKQTISLSNATKVTALIEILNQYVSSDMPISNMIYFAKEASGMDLNSSLNSATLPSDWVYPYLELRDAEVVQLVNSLGIYEEQVPVEALRIHHAAQ